MTVYATAAERHAFIRGLGDNPMFVFDLDGNVVSGFSLVEGQALLLSPGDDPANRAIPSGTGWNEIQALVAAGIVRPTLFARKAMDVRLPPDLVALINDCIAADRPFRLAGLTSRSSEDALNIFAESGVRRPDLATLVADSGGTMRVRGVRHDVYCLTGEDTAFLQDIADDRLTLQAIVMATVDALGFRARLCPPLYFERKNIAANIHYREILDAYGQGEGSALDRALGTVLKSAFDGRVAAGPSNAGGAPVFKTLDGPATVEIKVAEVNKGHGLEALLRAALESRWPPSAVGFSGDDICKGNGNPGTDYFAMIRSRALFETYGVPVYNVHTHHPVGATLDGTVPDPAKAPGRLLEAYDRPVIDLVVPNPAANVALVIDGLGDLAIRPTQQPGPAPRPF